MSTLVLPKLKLPRQQAPGKQYIDAPSPAGFAEQFCNAAPNPKMLLSDLGSTAVYDMPALSGDPRRQVLMVHGINTPGLGLLPLAKELQKLDNDAHVVFYDLWGHGLSSTPLLPHAPHIFHQQIYQVLGFMQWSQAHLIGFSFGGITVASFADHNPWMLSSATILGPAGLLKFSEFDDKMQELLLDSGAREEEAIKCVMEWLEGGPEIIVPTDAKERIAKGEVVAEALREWELQHHAGYPQSVLSMFRYGGVCDQDEIFKTFGARPVKKFGVCGGVDPVCSKAQLLEVGFKDVDVVEGEGHHFVRSKAAETARYIHSFWLRNTA